MNVTTRIIMTVLGLLVAVLGVSTVSASRHAGEVAAQLEKTRGELQKLKAVNPPVAGKDRSRRLLEEEQAANAKLRAEIERLQSDRPADAAAMPVNVPSAPATPRVDAPSTWMERLRQQEPERYKQIVAAQEQRRKDAEKWYADTLSQLDTRAQSTTSPEEAQLVNQIAEALAKIGDLHQQMQAARVLPEDQRQAAMTQLSADMRANYQQLNQLRDQDRTLQLQTLATQLGLKGDNMQTLVDSVPQIYKNTQYTPGRSGGGFWTGNDTTTPQTTTPPK